MNNSMQPINLQNDSHLSADFSEIEWFLELIDCRMLPTVTIGGLLLQSLNLIVLLSKRLRNNAIRFLAAMSLVDVLFLVVHIPFLPMPFIAQNHLHISSSPNAYYNFIERYYEPFFLVPISRILLATNSSLAVLVSFERYLALMPRLKCSCAPRFGKMSRRKLTLPAILAAVLLSAALNVTCFFQHNKAIFSNSDEFEESCGLGVEALDGPGAVVLFGLVYMLPLFLLVFFNTALVYLLLQYRRKQLSLQNSTAFSMNGSRSSWLLSNWWCCWQMNETRGRNHFVRANAFNIHRRRSTLSTAFMVIVAMVVHLALATPGIMLTILVFFEGRTSVLENSWIILASHVSNVLILLHCSIDW